MNIQRISTGVAIAVVIMVSNACSMCNNEAPVAALPAYGPHMNAAPFPTIFNVAQGLALQLQQNMRDGSLADYACVVTTLAQIDSLDKSSRFGRVMAEAIGAEIFRQGGNVREVRTADSIMLEPEEGEFSLSREASEIANSIDADAVVVGTYGVGRHSVAITVRMIDIQNRNVLSVAMTEIARTEAVDSLLQASNEPIPTVYNNL